MIEKKLKNNLLLNNKSISSGRDFLNLHYVLKNGLAGFDSIIINSLAEGRDIAPLIRLLTISHRFNPTAYLIGLITRFIIFNDRNKYIDQGENLYNQTDPFNIDLSGEKWIAEIHKLKNEISISLSDYIINLCKIISKNNNKDLVSDFNARALIVVGFFEASNMDFGFVEKTHIKNAVRDGSLCISLVFNQAVGDPRVERSAASLQPMFENNIIFGYDIKKKFIKSSVQEIYHLPAYIVTNVKLNYYEIFKKISGWQGQYRAQQVFFGSYIIGCCLYSYEINKIKNIFLYSHDMHGISIGQWVKITLEAINETKVHWGHDFHEYVEGVEFSDPARKEFFLKDQRRCIKSLDLAVTVSPGLASLLHQDYKLNSTVIYNCGLSFKRDSSFRYQTARSILKLSKNNPLIIYSGGISAQRRVGLPLRALKDIPLLNYCIITNESAESNAELNRILELAREMGVINRIHTLPYVEPDYAWELMVDATACLSMLPRYSNGDIALPNKLFDAIKAQTPFLSSNTPELEKFVSKNNCGEIFIADDENNFSQALVKLINNTYQISEDFYKKFTWNERFKLYSESVRSLFIKKL